MSGAVASLVGEELLAPVPPQAAAFAAGCWTVFEAPLAVLFYGSILRTGDLDGVMDFYVLTSRAPPGPAGPGHPPAVARRQLSRGGAGRSGAAGQGRDHDPGPVPGGDARAGDRHHDLGPLRPAGRAGLERRSGGGRQVVEAVADAARTAARFAAALGPAEGPPEAYWSALFQETYAAEFRVEKGGRERSILAFDVARYHRLLVACWREEGLLDIETASALVQPALDPAARRRIQAAWRLRRRMGRPLNYARLIKAAFTFEGAARYAAWKIERHTGMPVALTPWRERHPVLAAPGRALAALATAPGAE
jgi:hypothetical protein